ncbi:MAG: hypothetical protein RLZ51_236 [Pseudomonadota bacterium]
MNRAVSLKPQHLFYGWWVVLACFVIACFTWSLGLFGASVYLQVVTAERGWPIGTVAFAITVFYFTSACLQRLVGRSIDERGPRPVLLIAAISLGVGVALIGQVREPWHLMLCFVLVGVGWSALSTTGLSATVAPWFERHQGRSMTLAIMGASVGAMVGVPVLLFLVGRYGMASGFAIAGLTTTLVLLPIIAVVLRYKNPQALGLQRDGDSAPAITEQPQPAAEPPLANGLPSRKAAWLLWSAAVAFALGLMVQIGFATHHVKLALPHMSLTEAGWLVSATGLMGFLGRLVLARIVDRAPVRWLAAGALTAQVLSLWAIVIWPSATVLWIASLIYGYCVGHVTTLGPIVVRREFGAAAFGTRYGKAAMLIQFTSAMGPAFMGFMRDAFDAYAPVLALSALLNLVAVVALVAGRRMARAGSD